FKAMGSVCEFTLYVPKEIECSIVLKRLEHEVLLYESKYTRYKPDSITSAINSAAGTTEFIQLDDITVRLLDYAQALFELSEGMFDITCGILWQVWEVKSRELASEEKLATLIPRMAWDKVVRKDQSFNIPLGGMAIDFGGYVKEFV